jgi:PST family polysaccharide transporter
MHPLARQLRRAPNRELDRRPSLWAIIPVKRRVLNLVSLTCIQVSNGVLPVLIFPFTLGVVGGDFYAKVALSEALSVVLLTIVLYSFEIDGVAQVVGLDAEKDRDQLSLTFSAVFYVRMMLFAVAAPLVLLGAVLLDKQLVPLTLYWMLVPLSYAIQSSWLFLGLERNAPVALFTVLSRASAVALVFSLVEKPLDYARVPLLIGLASLAGAIASLVYTQQWLGLRFVAVPSATLKRMFWSGKELFAGNISGILFRDVNVIVLGALGVSGAAVASYSMAEKITKAMQASMRPLNQLFFPEALRIGRSADARGPTGVVLRRLLRITWPQLAALAGLWAILAVGYAAFGSAIPWLRRIENLDRVAGLVGFMGMVTFFGTANFTLGWAGLVALRAQRYLFGSILATGLISLASCFILASLVAENGAAICFVFAEALFLALVVRRYLR